MTAPNSISFLTYNIQAGVGTSSMVDYVTHSWRHVLPSLESKRNLAHIAETVAQYDVVGLQEIDAGSLRSGGINQIQQLAEHAGFPDWQTQVNRNLGHFAQHGLGLLAKFSPQSVREYKLPGRLPGRGALIAHFGDTTNSLTVIITHLSLTAYSRNLQLDALCRLIENDEHVIIMGDMNCTTSQLATHAGLCASHLRIHRLAGPTFPSWKPRRGIDHILTTPELKVTNQRVLQVRHSDHLPVAMQLELPPALYEAVVHAPRQAAGSPL